MRILSVQGTASVEFEVFTDDSDYPNLVRKGPDNWWCWMGQSLEPLSPANEHVLEKLFQEGHHEPKPPTCGWEKIDGAHGYRIWKGSCGRLGLRPAHQEYPTEEDLYCPSCGQLISVPPEVLKMIQLNAKRRNPSE